MIRALGRAVPVTPNVAVRVSISSWTSLVSKAVDNIASSRALRDLCPWLRRCPAAPCGAPSHSYAAACRRTAAPHIDSTMDMHGQMQSVKTSAPCSITCAPSATSDASWTGTPAPRPCCPWWCPEWTTVTLCWWVSLPLHSGDCNWPRTLLLTRWWVCAGVTMSLQLWRHCMHWLPIHHAASVLQTHVPPL